MRHLILLLSFLSIAACAAAPDAGMRGLNGSYRGELVNDGVPVPATTILRAGADGTVSGTFTFVESAGVTTSGKLDACRSPRSCTLVCRWSDRYGVGPLEMNFQPDLSSFDGRWSAEGRDTLYGWNGRRTGPAN